MPTNELETELAKKLALSIEKLDKMLHDLEKKHESKSSNNASTGEESSELELILPLMN